LLVKPRSVSDGTSDHDQNSASRQKTDSHLISKRWHMGNGSQRSGKFGDSPDARNRDGSLSMLFPAYPGQDEPYVLERRDPLPGDPDTSMESIGEADAVINDMNQHFLDWRESAGLKEAFQAPAQLPPQPGYPPRDMAALPTPVDPGLNCQEDVEDRSNDFLENGDVYGDSRELSIGNLNPQKGIAVNSQVPSPPPETHNSEFSITRKPLPALPNAFK